jgi:hypothetical protein
MPMPKGKKVGKYVTLSDREAMNYRTIARHMTNDGYKMNHATARGILIAGMKKIAVRVLIRVKGYANPEEVSALVKTEAFQGYVGDMLEERYLNVDI